MLFSPPSKVSNGVCTASRCSSGQQENTQEPPHMPCAPPQPKMKTVIQSSVNGGGLKIIGLQPVNDGFIGLPTCVTAKGVRFQLLPCNQQKSPKKRAGRVRSFHIPRTPGAQALRKPLNFLRWLEKERSGKAVSPVCHTNQNLSFLLYISGCEICAGAVLQAVSS